MVAVREYGCRHSTAAGGKKGHLDGSVNLPEGTLSQDSGTLTSRVIRLSMPPSVAVRRSA